MTSPVRDDVEAMDADTDTICSVCFAEFLDIEDLNIHLEQMHNTSKAFTLKRCPFCESSYPDAESFCYHLRDEHISRLITCRYCSKCFVDPQKHHQHEKKHKNIARNLLLCSQCANTFTNTKELQSHEVDNHANNFDGIVLQDIHAHLSSILNINFVTFINNIGSHVAFTCKQCGFSSYDVDGYIKHLQNKNCKSRTCDNCGMVFKYSDKLKRHLKRNKTCSNIIRDVYIQCKECMKDIKKEVYKEHVKKCKVYKCTICNTIYETMIQLSEHQGVEHPLSIEIKHCKFCSRECVGTIALQKHLERTHMIDLHLYKYKCKTCQEVFKHPQKLFAHYFLKHRDLLPYTCKICDKKFRIRKKFTLHIKLEHNSVGFVEFDQNYHVYFVDKKSENPFIPTSLMNEDNFGADMPELALILSKNKDKVYDPSKKTKTDKPSTLTVKALREKAIQNENQGLTSEMPTETEGNVTEVETKPKLKRKRNKKNLQSKKGKPDVILLESSDDDEPLLSLKNNHMKKKSLFKNDKTRFTCKICQKYCYTYQNYHNHMSIHSKSEKKTCIKCSREFKSNEKLERHMKAEHSSSKLTEYLKNILEKRKEKIQVNKELSTSEKFQSTIKKVKLDNFSSSAKIKVIEKGQCVRNFIENFTLDEKNGKNVTINNSVTVKAVNTPFYRQPVIKMKKFEPEKEVTSPKLAMPVKCVTDEVMYNKKVNVTIKLVQGSLKSKFQLTAKPIHHDEYEDQNYISEHDDTRDSIPDVADEVLIENEETKPEEPKQAPQKIILDNIPKGYSDISIAHLSAEAPYFKIVRVNKILKTGAAKEETKEEPAKEIELPNGTKLVTVNPLAHLLDKPVEEVLSNAKNRYYKPKIRNFESLLKNALINLDGCNKAKTTKRKKTSKGDKTE